MTGTPVQTSAPRGQACAPDLLGTVKVYTTLTHSINLLRCPADCSAAGSLYKFAGPLITIVGFTTMPTIIIELHGERLGPIELQTPPQKTAAKVLDACSRKFNRGVGSLSPKGKPNLLLEDDDVVAGGETYVFTPSAGSQGIHHIFHVSGRLTRPYADPLAASAFYFHSSRADSIVLTISSHMLPIQHLVCLPSECITASKLCRWFELTQLARM